MTQDLFAFFDEHPLSHISTGGGAELGGVAGLAMLDVVEAPGFLERVREVGERLERGPLDLAANLHKEQLTQWIPAVLEAANRALDTPLTADEVDRYYRSNARLWEVMLRLRRADRWWQRRVRRRAYPFLLPGPTRR